MLSFETQKYLLLTSVILLQGFGEKDGWGRMVGQKKQGSSQRKKFGDNPCIL
jgi:hypothetical protein